MSLLILFLSTLSITERGVLKSLKIDLPISPCSFISFAKYILMLCLLVHTPYGIIIFSWRISIFIARVNVDILTEETEITRRCHLLWIIPRGGKEKE